MRINNKKWSQDELAAKLNITQTNLSAIESGKHDKIDFLLMDKICKVFEVDLNYFLDPNGQKQIIKGENAKGYMANIYNISIPELLIEQFEKRIELLTKTIEDKDLMIAFLQKVIQEKN